MDDSDGYERDEIDDIIDGSGTETSISRSSTASSIASRNDAIGSVDDRVLQEIEKLRGMKLFLERPRTDKHTRVPLIQDLKPVNDNTEEGNKFVSPTETEKETNKELESCKTVPLADVAESKETKDPPVDRFTLQPSPPFTERPADRHSPVNASEQTTVEIKLLKEQGVEVPSLPTSIDQVAKGTELIDHHEVSY